LPNFTLPEEIKLILVSHSLNSFLSAFTVFLLLALFVLRLSSSSLPANESEKEKMGKQGQLRMNA
jgi:hypothetical protein